ncbi:hypothetical protein GP486_002952 [Trichoglossum hirsutum]|uniref:Short-chain dehydrogenase/reductase 3 n=1 Tax=Trichoglossum hirsutum TaxID=265104 RepID=A0A9P8LE02_9PEZI|nr:hypothetical protein GP486_002952 [Trichoglossum hirsutum]
MSDPAIPDRPWHNPLTIDLLHKVLNTTFFHPFVAWIIPLCLRAQVTPYEHPAMLITVSWATLLTLLFFLSILNRRIAYGKPREVDLNDEVIVITGGASGLGLLIAEVYGLRGASVAVLDVRELEVGEARGVEFYKCDVGDREQVERVAKEIEEDFSCDAKQLGTPTILINNAAIAHGKSILDLSHEEIERTFRVNLLSHFHTIKTFLPGMIRENRGTVVTMSSVLAHLGCRNLSDYTSSKSALLALHASLTAELLHTHQKTIKTLLVTPGQITTPLFAGIKTPAPFLAPVLEPVDVAKEVIKAIDSGEGGVIAMPLYARWLPWMGVLPAGLHSVLRWWSGVDVAVEGFVGRNGEEQTEKGKEKEETRYFEG